jgi:hypothetical protein
LLNLKDDCYEWTFIPDRDYDFFVKFDCDDYEPPYFYPDDRYEVYIDGKKVDEWISSLVYQGTGQNKIAYNDNSLTSSNNGKFTIGTISPSPVIDDAKFKVNVLEEGILNVAIYDLTGAFVMDILSNKFMSADTEFEVPMHLGLLSNGTYNVMISVGDDVVMRPIIINR